MSLYCRLSACYLWCRSAHRTDIRDSFRHNTQQFNSYEPTCDDSRCHRPAEWIHIFWLSFWRSGRLSLYQHDFADASSCIASDTFKFSTFLRTARLQKQMWKPVKPAYSTVRFDTPESSHNLDSATQATTNQTTTLKTTPAAVQTPGARETAAQISSSGQSQTTGSSSTLSTPVATMSHNPPASRLSPSLLRQHRIPSMTLSHHQTQSLCSVQSLRQSETSHLHPIQCQLKRDSLQNKHWHQYLQIHQAHLLHFQAYHKAHIALTWAENQIRLKLRCQHLMRQ